jgi:hypothetical protein
MDTIITKIIILTAQIRNPSRKANPITKIMSKMAHPLLKKPQAIC